MIPLDWIWCGLCALSVVLLVLLLWAWMGAEETSEEEQQSGRDE